MSRAGPGAPAKRPPRPGPSPTPSAPRPDSCRVSVGDLRLHFLDWGEAGGIPLVLVHGGSANAHWWDFFAAELRGRRRVLALDLRGHGDSDWHPAGEYSVEAHAADLGSFLDRLGVERTVLIGHSFGGLPVTACAAAAPDRVAAVVLVDSRLGVSERGARVMAGLARLPHPTYATVEEACDRFRLLPAATSAPPEVLAHVVLNVIRQREDGSWTLRFDRRTLAATAPCDLSPLLARLPVPVLIVRGAESDFLPRVVVQRWVAATPRASAVEIPGAHHHVMLDAPATLARAIEAFLASHGL